MPQNNPFVAYSDDELSGFNEQLVGIAGDQRVNPAQKQSIQSALGMIHAERQRRGYASAEAPQGFGEQHPVLDALADPLATAYKYSGGELMDAAARKMSTVGSKIAEQTTLKDFLLQGFNPAATLAQATKKAYLDKAPVDEADPMTGVKRAIGSTVGGTLGDPRMLPFLGLGGAGAATRAAAGLAFSGTSAYGAAQSVEAAAEAKTPAEAAEHATQAGVQTVFAMLGALGIRGGRAEVSPAKGAIKPMPGENIREQAPTPETTFAHQAQSDPTMVGQHSLPESNTPFLPVEDYEAANPLRNQAATTPRVAPDAGEPRPMKTGTLAESDMPPAPIHEMPPSPLEKLFEPAPKRLAPMPEPPESRYTRIKKDIEEGIVYHGTDETAAESIMDKGFRPHRFGEVARETMRELGNPELTRSQKRSLSNLYQSYKNQEGTFSVTPAGEVASRWAGKGGEIAAQIRQIVTGKRSTAGKTAVVIRGKLTESGKQSESYKQLTRTISRIDEALAKPESERGYPFTEDMAADELWGEYRDMRLRPEHVRPVDVIRDMEALKKGPAKSEPLYKSSLPAPAKSVVTLGNPVEGSLFGSKTPAIKHDILVDGKKAGILSLRKEGNTAAIEWIGDPEQAIGEYYKGIKNQLGVKGVRQIGAEIKRLHPEVTKITGERVSGASKKAGTDVRVTETKVPTPKAKPPLADTDVVRASVEALQKSKQPFTDAAVESLERITGRTLKGLPYERQIHNLNNWQQEKIAQDYLDKQPSPEGKNAWAEAKSFESGLVADNPVMADLTKALKESIEREMPDAHPDVKAKAYLEAIKPLAKLSKDPNRAQKAIDKTRNKERGSFSTGPRYTSSEIKLMAQDHVGVVLNRYEKMSEAMLAARKANDFLNEPALRKFVEEANDPALEARYTALVERAGNAKLSNPVDALYLTIGDKRFSPGDIARGSLRHSLGTLARNKEVLSHKLDGYIREWDKADIDQTLDFTERMETGTPQNNPFDNEVAKTLRNLLDDRRKQIADLGTGKLEDFIENYFPHIWRHPASFRTLASRLMSRSPLQGPATFLKERTYDFFTDGLRAGLEPVTYNPVRMALIRLHEMERYLALHESLNELHASGIAKGIGPKDPKPPGWVPIQDFISLGEKSPGKVYMPADAAKIFNNYLGPGLRGALLFDTLSAYNNRLNQINLGLSTFHFIETSVDSSFSEFALGLDKLQRGKVSGVKNLGRALTLVGPPIRAYLKGNRLLAEYMEPGRYADMTSIADAMEPAGGRAHMPEQYKNNAVESFRNAKKEYQISEGYNRLPKAGKVAVNATLALMEKMNAPIMEKFVPRLKLGVFANLAEEILTRLPAESTPKEILRAELSKAWDSVDNRLGEVVYDNKMWDRRVKDLAHLSIRSVGWNYGTVNELGGGIIDLGKSLKNREALSQRTLYTLSLGVMGAYIGSIIQYTYTGELPKEVIDAYYPRTGKIRPDGKPERIYLKTYINDAISFYHDPVATVGHKSSPLLNQAWDLVRNQDFFGEEIRPIHTSMADALTDPDTYKGTARYLGKSALPFSVTNFAERHKTSGNIAEPLAASALALIPAPRSIGQSEAESYFYEVAKRQLTQGPATHEERERQRNIRQLETKFYTKEIKLSDLFAATKRGELAPDDLDRIVDSSRMTPLERHALHSSPEQFLKGYSLATPAEKKTLRPIALQKWDTIDGKYNPETTKKINQAFRDAIRASR